MNQTWLQNSLIEGSHVMGLCRLIYIMFWFIPQYNYLVFFSSFCVPDHESKVPAGSASDNFLLLDKIDFSKIIPRYLKVEDMWGAISAEILFVSWYICRSIGASKLNIFYTWCLVIWVFPDKGLGIGRRGHKPGRGPNMGRICPSWVRLVYFLRKSKEFHVNRTECQRILFHFLLLILS